MDTKILSSIEEIAVLNALIDNYDRMELSTRGSSRLVYALPTKQMRELCTLIEIPYKEYIIKVALGEGGKNQMDNEVSAWNAYAGFLKMAPIAAYGKYVEIMERVTPFDEDDSDEGFDITEERAWYAAEENDIWGFAYWSFFCGWYLELIKADNDLSSAHEKEEEMTSNDYHDAVLSARDYAIYMGQLDELGFEKAMDMSKQLVAAFNDFQEELGDTSDNCQFGRNMNTGEIQNYDYGFRGDGWSFSHVWSSSIGTWRTGFEYQMYFYDLKMSLLYPTRGISLKSIEEVWNAGDNQ